MKVAKTYVDDCGALTQTRPQFLMTDPPSAPLSVAQRQTKVISCGQSANKKGDASVQPC